MLALNYYCGTHLLAQTDPWPCIEGQEDEGVRRQVSLNPIVDETHGVKIEGVRPPEVLQSNKRVLNLSG